jgi:hypothetical protein
MADDVQVGEWQSRELSLDLGLEKIVHIAYRQVDMQQSRDISRARCELQICCRSIFMPIGIKLNFPRLAILLACYQAKEKRGIL